MAQTTPRQIRLGIIVPSSNTALEPLTQHIISDIPHTTAKVSVHFARFRVTTIALSDEANSQFALEPMLEAAKLLADAKVDMIGWSGTSASWLGFSTDELLCEKIQEVTGVPATSSVLAMRDLYASRNPETIGLLTPYTPDVNEAIRRNLETNGISITQQRSRCSGLSNNFDFAGVGEAELDKLMEQVIAEGAETVLIVCTNMAAAHKVVIWEKLHEVVVLDSVATVLHSMLRKLEVDSMALGEKWGSLFRM
jgi:maleate isomerase